MYAEVIFPNCVDNCLLFDTNGFLNAVGESGSDYELTVVKVYTMPDGQPGVKLMRTK